MKNKASSSASDLLKLLLFVVVFIAFLYLLDSCGKESEKRSDERQSQIVADFMIDYGNPGERALDGAYDPSDLRSGYEDGALDIEDIMQEYEDLFMRSLDEANKWDQVEKKYWR